MPTWLARGPGLHLLTDGESVFLRDSERGVIDLLRNTQQPLLAICVGPVLERVLAPDLAGAAPLPRRLQLGSCRKKEFSTGTHGPRRSVPGTDDNAVRATSSYGHKQAVFCTRLWR